MLGELQFSVEEVAAIMEIDFKTFEREIKKDPKISIIYRRGMLKADAAVRKAIFEQAKQGSTPAQKQMIELINKAKNPTPKQPGPPTKNEGEIWE
mgnify:CR=1 FL=1